jgi:hypothetical protein
MQGDVVQEWAPAFGLKVFGSSKGGSDAKAKR